MGTQPVVVHSDPEILGGGRYSLEPGCRCGTSSTTSSEDTASTSSSTRFHRSRGNRPWQLARHLSDHDVRTVQQEGGLVPRRATCTD